MSTPVAVKSTTATSDGSVAVIDVQTMKPICPLSTIFMAVGGLSKMQWHPVSPVRSDISDKMSDSESHMKIYFKKYGKWTTKLADAVATGDISTVTIDGPYGGVTHDLELCQHEYVIMMTGGIAITPMLALLNHMITAEWCEAITDVESITKGSELELQKMDTSEKPTRSTNPKGIVLVWAVRHLAELEVMDDKIYQVARTQKHLFDLRLHFTGKDRDFSELEEETDNLARTSSKVGLKNGNVHVRPSRVSSAINSWFVGSERSMINQWLWRVSPVAIPMHLGPVHLAIITILTYLGGFVGFLLGNAWILEHTRSLTATERDRIDTVVFFLVMMVSMGLAALVVIPVHLWLFGKAVANSESKISKGHSAESSSVKLSAATIQWIKDTMVTGRPNIDGVLSEVNGKLMDDGTAAVYAAGPKGMVNATALACLSYNGRLKMKPPFIFDVEAFEL